MANITKIYEIKLQGEKQLVSEMQQVSKQFDDAKKRFKDLKNLILAGGLSAGDLAKYKLEMQAAKIETEKLRQETIRLTNDGKALTNAQRIQREEQRKNREATSQSLTEYQLLSKQLNTLRNTAKEVGVVFGTESNEFRQAANEANKLDQQLKKIDASLGQFQRTVGNYPKEIKIGSLSTGVMNQLRDSGLGDVLGNQVNETRGKVIQLNSEFAEMKIRLDQARASGTGDLREIERGLIQNRVAADALNNEIRQSQVHLNGMGSVGSGVFGNMGGDIKGMILGYIGLQAAMSSVQELVKGTKELSDTTTNLEIELGGTSETAGLLVENLGKLDTRTKLTSLAEIANIATKAGTSEENLLGVTEAIDKVKVSFGKDFGDVETGTETFAKLINVFYDDREITGDRILKIGNSIRTLANETVASVPYINDFNGRMAGLRQIFTNFELSDSIGLGAGFEEFKQSAEVSSTALVKILPKLAADTTKFAKILGIPQEEFKKLINQNPAEALIRVSEKLVKSGKGVEDIATSFADAELGAGRITTILGTLGGKADVFRERIARAKDTIKDTTNINDAFAKKNENLAGTLDKISKKFSDMANNKSFINFVSVSGSLILGFISIVTGIPFAWWFGMLGFLTLAYWSNVTALYATISATALKIATQIREIALQAAANALMLGATIINYAASVAVYAVAYSYQFLTLALNFLTTIFPVVRTAMLLLNATFLATPIGWIIAGIIAVGAVSTAFAGKVDNVTNSLKKQGEALKLTAAQIRVNAEIEKKATESTSERIAKIKVLTQIAGNLENSDIGRKKAMQELIAIDGKYSEAMDGNIIRTDKLRQITDALTRSILMQAKAEAAKNLLVEKQKKIIENNFKQDEIRPEADKLKKNVGFVQGAKAIGQSIGYNVFGTQGTAADQLTELYLENKKLQEDVDALAGIVAKDTTDNSKNPTNSDGAPANPNDLKDGKGSKLSGQQKDFLRDTNALREAELSELKKKKLEGSITEEEFLKKSLAVNILYNNKILNHFKGTDATTRKLRADTSANSIDEEIKTNEALFKIQEENLNQALSNKKAISQAKLDEVTTDPFASNLEKAEAERTFYEEVLNMQIDFNTKMDALENDFKQKSKKNNEERKNLILKEQTDLKNKSIALNKAQFDALFERNNTIKESLLNNAEIEASRKRLLILNNKSLTQKEKEIELNKLNAKLELEKTNSELGKVKADLSIYDFKLLTQKLTNEEYKKYLELIKDEQLLLEKKATGEQAVTTSGKQNLKGGSDGNTQESIKQFVLKEFKLDESQYGDLLGSVIAGSFDLAGQAMNNYFEGEKQAVEKSKQLAYERIDLEKRQLLAKAQSENERQSIEKQSAEKKRVADKEAGEKLKKIKKSEATIAFATQLANIGVAAAGNPANAFTFGAAGIAMYATLAAIATAGYLMNLSNINKQQFGIGGRFGSGGKLSGPSHSQNNGMPVINPDTGEVQAFMEGDEAIINKTSMRDNSTYTVSGTPSQIASKINAIGGGVDWMGGASLTKYMNGGTYLGSNVQPPYFKSYAENRSGLIIQNNTDFERLDRIEKMIENTNYTLQREVNRKTIVSSREISQTQRENQKASDIATL